MTSTAGTPRLAIRLPIRSSAEDIARLRTRKGTLNLPVTSTVRALTLQALAGERHRRLNELEAVAVAALPAAKHAITYRRRLERDYEQHMCGRRPEIELGRG